MRTVVTAIAVIFLAGWSSLNAVTMPDQSAGAAAQEEGAPELEAVGGLAVGNLYMAYISLGAVYDNFVTQNYDAEQAISLAESIRELVDTSVDHLRKVQRSPSISVEDATFITGMVDAFMTVRNEATYFVAYAQSGSDGDNEQFQAERQKAWEKISGMFAE